MYRIDFISEQCSNVAASLENTWMRRGGEQYNKALVAPKIIQKVPKVSIPCKITSRDKERAQPKHNVRAAGRKQRVRVMPRCQTNKHTNGTPHEYTRGKRGATGARYVSPVGNGDATR